MVGNGTGLEVEKIRFVPIALYSRKNREIHFDDFIAVAYVRHYSIIVIPQAHGGLFPLKSISHRKQVCGSWQGGPWPSPMHPMALSMTSSPFPQ